MKQFIHQSDEALNVLRQCVRECLTLSVSAFATSAALDETNRTSLPLAKALPHVARAADAVLVGDASANATSMLRTVPPLRQLSFAIFTAFNGDGDNELSATDVVDDI